MSAAAKALQAFDDTVAEMSTWTGPYGHPGVAEFIARRDTHLRKALARLGEPDLDNDDTPDTEDIDDEEFCPRCLAGVTSDEHHGKCVVTGHALDGEPAAPLTEAERGPLPSEPGFYTEPDGLSYLINENGHIEPGTRHYPTTTTS